jgi:integrase
MRTRAGVILKAAMYRQPAAEPERRPAMRPRRETAIAQRPGTPPGPRPVAAPVEYAVAVDRYLADATLGEASRRVYRISLTGWAWALVGQRAPRGTGRRGAAPPVVPLALLDGAEAGHRLAAALADRGAQADPRTVNRELSALRSAVGWWQDQGWISGDPTAGLRHLPGQAAPVPALTGGQIADLFRVQATLREHAFWRLLYDSGAHVDEVLGLDAWRLDLVHGTAPAVRQPRGSHWIRWRASTGELLGLLLAGRSAGPVFLTDRKAPARAARADVCPFTGRARMSYRRAAEIFGTATRPLDPAGRGWTLGQLRQAGLEARTG